MFSSDFVSADTGTENLEADAVESFPLLEPPPSPVRMSQGRPTAHLQLPPVHRPHAVATTAFNDRQSKFLFHFVFHRLDWGK